VRFLFARTLAVLWVVLAVAAAYLWYSREPRTVTLSGTIVVPLEWGDTDLTLDLSAAEQIETGDVQALFEQARRRRTVSGSTMHEDPNRPRHYLWKIGGVVPGKYVVRSKEFTLAQCVDVGPEGCDGIDLIIGPKAEVTLEVLSLDSEDLSLPRQLDVEWNCRPPPAESQFVQTKPARWNAADKVFCFVAPAGDVEVSLSDDEFEVVGDSTLHLRPGANAFTVKVRKRSEDSR
jgi:hypothetical protein